MKLSAKVIDLQYRITVMYKYLDYFNIDIEFDFDKYCIYSSKECNVSFIEEYDSPMPYLQYSGCKHYITKDHSLRNLLKCYMAMKEKYWHILPKETEMREALIKLLLLKK